MPNRDVAPLGAPCWIDLLSADTAASRRFYGELFGWTSAEAGPEYGGYINFARDGVPVAGCMQKQPDMNVPDVWSVYLATANAQATSKAATAYGGVVHMEPMEVPELGFMGMAADAGGAMIGLWQPKAHQGFGVIDEPGAPGWFELHTRDYEPTVRFYREVFGWDTHAVSDAPEFRYTTLGEGDDALAGIMDAGAFLPDGVPAHWSVYFRVEDADATLKHVEELGGSVVMAAEDTPYGRLASASDPTGALFKLVAG